MAGRDQSPGGIGVRNWTMMIIMALMCAAAIEFHAYGSAAFSAILAIRYAIGEAIKETVWRIESREQRPNPDENRKT